MDALVVHALPVSSNNSADTQLGKSELNRQSLQMRVRPSTRPNAIITGGMQILRQHISSHARGQLSLENNNKKICS